MGKNCRQLIACLLTLLLLLTVGCSPEPTVEAPVTGRPGEVVQPSLDPRPLRGRVLAITKNGSLQLSISSREMEKAGYVLGDLLTVTLGDRVFTLPYCTALTDVDVGEPLLCLRKEDLFLTCNSRDFATSSGIAVRQEQEDRYHWVYPPDADIPLQVTISLDTAGGYYEQFQIRQLHQSNNREDYPQLSEEAFANFRAIETTGMGKGILYRSSSPIDPALNRNLFADQACMDHTIRLVVNFEDNRSEAAAYPGFGESYYAWQNARYLDAGMDFTAPAFGEALADMVRFLISGDGPYLIHCRDGKDQTGVVAALLECLMGASLEEVEQDYLLSYYNYYGVDPASPRARLIAEANIRKVLSTLFVIEDLPHADLSSAARTFFLTQGVTDRELDQLIRQLSQGPVVVPVRHTVD